ncbi:MAG: 2-hydroxyacid dehydrogenase [Streptomycetales bacterium]
MGQPPARTPRVLVSRRVPAAVHRALDATFDLDYHDSEIPLPRAELLARAAGSDGIVTTLTERADAELIDAASPRLCVVANYAVGFDNVDLDAASARDVLVSNTPDVLTAATAEFAVALMLSLLRRVTEGDRFLRRREPWIWAPTMMLGPGLAGRTLGIVGYGRIGREVARLARAVGMNVICTDIAAPAAGDDGHVPLPRLLDDADIVSLHCPLVPETRHLIGREELARMRGDAFLVNTARGPIVDEQALVDALRAGQIAGAALDVFEAEPRVTDALLEFDNVVVTPHLASATQDAREAMGRLCLDALDAVLLRGEPPRNALNASRVRLAAPRIRRPAP